MKSESSEGYSKLYWIFMYSAWIFIELISLAAVAYSIYSVVILIRGNWAGAAVFAGIIPGYVLLIAGMYIYMLTKIPWRAGDYQSDLPYYEYQVRQVRLFHTILQNDKSLKTQPHMDIDLELLEPEGKKDGFLVYHYQTSGGSEFYGRFRWLAYAKAILREVFVFAVLFLSLWFMAWAGVEASVFFLSGALLFSVGTGILCRSRNVKDFQSSDRAHAIGLAWVVIEYHGSPHLMHFVLYDWLQPLTSRSRQERMLAIQRLEQAKNKELNETV